MSSCAKCHQCPAAEADSWCLGCTAWEALQAELTARWHTPAVRALANDAVVSAVKLVRALRNVSSGLKSAGDSQAARSQREEGKAETTRDRAPLPRSRESEAAVRVKEPPPSSEGSQDESEESSHQPGLAAKSDPARRPPEPAVPPRLPPPPKRPRSEERGSTREEGRVHRTSREADHREEGHHQHHHSEGKKKEKKKSKRGHRAGRNHARVYRALEDPNIRIHRRPPGQFWDQPDRVPALGGRHSHR